MVSATEAVLTWRARRRFVRKQKQKQKNVVLDWVEAFVWSACVVLLVNQYLFQAYAIPSPSMEPTLLGHDLPGDSAHDRIFVNKFVYGPELVPGMFKMPGFAVPQRGEIIIFESPEYLSSGPLFDIGQRLAYMMTLSLVDLDVERDPETGKTTPKAHFLIKRGVGYSDDVVRWRKGLPEFQLPGTDTWLPEETLKSQQGLTYGQHRNTKADLTMYYGLLPGVYRALVATEQGRTPEPADLEARSTFNSLPKGLQDGVEMGHLYAKAWLAFEPQNAEKTSAYFKVENGTWIPTGSILPLGDNRDNSNDGRYFGSIPLNKILGEASFRYWPLDRAGGL